MSANESRPTESGTASKSFGGDNTMVPRPTALPLWIAVQHGYKLEPPGPTTEDERRHLSYEAHDRSRHYDLERAFGRQYVAEFGGAA